MAKKRKRKVSPPTPPAPPRPPWRERLPWQIGALALLVLLAYANSLDGSFQFDDQMALADPSVVGPGFGWGILRLIQTRPLSFLTFHWNYLAAGNNPTSYHLVNLLLHAANAVLLLLIARRHLSSGTAFVAAALFALHPLQTEAVTYIFQRASVLSAFFALLSFLLFLRERRAWSVAAFALSLLAKEETMALPALPLLYDLVYLRRRPRWGYYAAMLGIAGLFAGRLFYVLRVTNFPTVGYRTKGITAFSYALTQPRVVWTYLRLFVFPVGLNLDHDVTVSRSLFSPPFTLPALLAMTALVGTLFWLAWRGNRPAFWGLGFFILLAPTSSIIPVRDVMFEHRVYFPLACLAIAVAGLLALMPRRLFALAVAAILMALLAATVARNRVWHDQKSLWMDALEKSPNKARPYGVLGMIWVTEDPERARQYLEHALTLKPDDSSIQTGLGLASLLLKDGPGALQHFQQAIALGGATPEHLTNLAMAYHLVGKLDQAIDNYHRALEIDPCMAKARWNLVRALATQGKKLEALAAGEVPANCRLLPEEAQRLKQIRRSLK